MTEIVVLIEHYPDGQPHQWVATYMWDYAPWFDTAETPEELFREVQENLPQWIAWCNSAQGE